MPPRIRHALVVRSADRFLTHAPGVTSRHCFSFGEHYDPANVGFGILVSVNDEKLDPGAGFTSHPHAGIDIVTWVVQGQLEHADDSGRVEVIGAGAVAVLRAGRGVSHSERNAGDGVCRFIQSWLVGDSLDDASYERVEARPGEGVALQIGLPTGARLHAGQLLPAQRSRLPAAPLMHLFVMRGALTLDAGDPLEAGDSVRLVQAGEQWIVAGPEGADIHLWTLPADESRAQD